MPEEVEPKYAEINAITLNWQQGDYWLGRDCEFAFLPNIIHHIASEEEPANEEYVIFQEVDGLCVITQTCDIVRCCKSRPYIELSPLVKVNDIQLAEIEKGKRPNYGS